MNIELFLRVLPIVILYLVMVYYCLISIFSASAIAYEMDSWLALFVALLVSATVGPIFYLILIIGKLYMICRYFNSGGSSVAYVYREAIEETTIFIFDVASKLSDLAKLRFTKKGRAKRQMMLREELWNDEFYCGEY
tara:strand:+ start:2002 stop:2412 length:411 start_codon:yes stop_codon:yes gene_type:complete